MSKFYEGQVVRRVDGSTEPEMVAGNLYTVTGVDALQQSIVVAGSDKKWNTAAFDPAPHGADDE